MQNLSPIPKPPFFRLILLLTMVVGVILVNQFDSLAKVIRSRIYTINTDHVIQKAELTEITNQAIAEIETRKQDSLESIDNKTKEAVSAEETVTNQVVSKDILKAINKARRETR